MWKSLIYLDEDLPSSIALRFAAEQANKTSGRLQVFHVEDPGKKAAPGTGWVRRSWEQGLVKAGLDEVHRLLKTEKVNCPHVGSPKVLVGQRDDEVLNELRHGVYDLYIEGYLNTSSIKDFFHLLNSRRFQNITCPVMLVKNMVPVHNILILAGEAVPFEALIPCFGKIYETFDGHLDITLLYYQFREEKELVFQERKEAGSYLDRAESMLAAAGWEDIECQVVQGTPEQAAVYMRNYGLVISTFPSRQTPRAELLALLSNPMLLCKPKSSSSKKPGKLEQEV